IANGYVISAKDIRGGWGNVIRIIHVLPDGETYESIYAHCDELFAKKGSYVSKGERIGSVGSASGQYLAHLHLEIRNKIGMDIGGGYSKNIIGFLNPTELIKNNRK